MNEWIVDADVSCGRAEQKALRYYASLHERVTSKSYVPLLTADIRAWRQHHRGARLPFLPRSWRKMTANTEDYAGKLQWLKRTGKLDEYLDRSISYIYMRDLGQAIDAPEVQDRIQRMAADVKRRLILAKEPKPGELPAYVSLTELYRWAQREGIESAFIWVIDKLDGTAAHIPDGMNAEHAQRKLIKLIVGVVLHAYEELDGVHSAEERARRLDQAIRLGYAYGLTYPFIDDLLDAQVLTDQEKIDYAGIIRTALLTGDVPQQAMWTGANEKVMRFIQAELTEAFAYMKQVQGERQREFFEQAYIFFHAQEQDRAKQLSHAAYTNEALYTPIILKSAYSRLIARAVLGEQHDEGFEERTFYYGIYNQLADDLADLFDDLNDGAVTPYTYYLTYRHQRPDLLNPFELYWAVIAALIHDVYASDPKTREVILSRAVNGLRRCKARIGKEAYHSLLADLSIDDPDFQRLIMRQVDGAEDVDFLDKLLRDQLIAALRKGRSFKEVFRETVDTAREQINRALPIALPDGIDPMKATLIEAANYSLAGEGKRLRPVLTWVMGVQEYGLSAEAIIPLLRSLEYMHTASLIFDDLPTQDNAAVRRGRSTLHRVHDSATAELTGLYLIQKAIHEQASLHAFDAETVTALIRYSAQTAEELCMGQAMDLAVRDRPLTLAQLNSLCHYKTGLAFEAALVMPAILARVDEQEIGQLRMFAYHAGIAYQIKDDLLDYEGDALLLGKPVGQDADNNRSTFVTVLGPEEAKKAMWEHYCLAMEALGAMPRRSEFLAHILQYMISRDR